MTITLDSIQFRIPGANNGAFNISIPANDGGSRTLITGPEWKPGASLPAAFAKQNPVAAPFIDVSFSCTGMGQGPVAAQIQATAVDGHILGDIAPHDVSLQNGPLAVRLVLNDARINGVSHAKIQWHWQVTLGQQYFTFDTGHEIYTTIAQPSAPWETAGHDPSASPWQEALDRACAWANGATTSDEILGAIAEHHYHAGVLKYGVDSYTEGSDPNAEEGIFKLDRFLSDQLFGDVNFVDCADCATIVALFGGLVGATCHVSVLAGHGGMGFAPAPGNILVGGEADTPGFNHHEVVWSTRDRDTTLVWDCCLGRSVSGRPEPYTGLRFNDPGNPTATTTYPAIAFTLVGGLILDAMDSESDIRQIKETAAIFNLRRPVDPTKFEFDQWRDTFRDFEGLVFHNFSFIAGGFGEVLPVKIWQYTKQPKPWLVDSVCRFLGEKIQVGVFEGDSRSDAHLVLYRLLDGRRVTPALERLDQPIGDVLFYDSTRQSDILLFARGNLVVRIKRSHGSSAALLAAAQAIDAVLTNGLAPIQTGMAAATEIVQQSFPMHLPGVPQMIRFLSNAGALVLDGAAARLQGHG